MNTIATLFSGGECVGVGARAAGLRHLWGIENDPDIAAVAQANGFDVRVADVCQVDPDTLEAPDVLHASPPCPSFSTAKQDAHETALDVELGQATARFIRVLRPRFFTLENVYMYRRSESWRIIAAALAECGYMFDVAHLNSADAGVPQTRKRMWVRAVRGGLVPHLPAPEPWVGWYAAIEDLIPDLPDDEFAPWQLERMPASLRETVLLAQGHYAGEPLLTRAADEPAGTVTANRNMTSMRAFVAGATSDGFAIRDADEPANTVLASNPRRPTRAFLVSSYDSPDSDSKPPRAGDTPSPTVTTGAQGRWRAFLATGQSNKPHGAGDWGPQIREGDEPVPTITASNKCDTRAFVVDGGNARQDVPTIRGADEPVFSVVASSDKAPARASVHGRVVRMTTRCLARWQSVPDEYILPDQKTLAAKIIGNAVPPLWYEKIIRSLIG